MMLRKLTVNFFRSSSRRHQPVHLVCLLPRQPFLFTRLSGLRAYHSDFEDSDLEGMSDEENSVNLLSDDELNIADTPLQQIGL